jgi:hypothetical protein
MLGGGVPFIHTLLDSVWAKEANSWATLLASLLMDLKRHALKLVVFLRIPLTIFPKYNLGFPPLLMRSMMMELSLSKITSWNPYSSARSTALYNA